MLVLRASMPIMTAMLLSLGFATPMSADQGRDRGGCNQADDADRGIASCTGLIQSGTLDGKELADAYYRRGSLYVWQRADFDRGIADLDRALELDPDLVMAYRTRGWAHQMNRDYERANADYDAAIRRTVDDCPLSLKKPLHQS